MIGQKKQNISIIDRGTAATLFILVIFIFSLNPKAFTQPPPNPDIDSISITNDFPIISWFPNMSNTTGYSVFRGRFESVGGSTFLIFDSITSLFGIQENSYIDNNVSACTQQRLYKVRAFNDTYASNWLYADTMQTILITQIDFDLCSNTVSLQWEKYKNMRIEMGGYWILASVDGGPYSIVGTTSPSQQYFTHTMLLPDVQYSYKIRAFNEDKTRSSTSCERSVQTQTYAKPTFTHIKYASVENNEHIKLEWLSDEAPISKYEILRSENGINFAVIGEFEDDVNYTPPSVFIDTTADFNAMSYHYKINVYDFCDHKIFESANEARSIHLTGETGYVGFLNELEWNTYDGWDLGVKNYQVYRKIDGVLNPSGFLEELPPTVTFYDDDVTGFGNFEGDFTYYIVATENDGNNGFESTPDKSTSNEVTISQETRILIPNAFIPGGTPPDDEFKPVISFIEQENYTLLIFNKWGTQIFKSNEISTGWDGTFNGEYVRSDTYVYVIKFQNARGEATEKQGTVTVVR